MDSTVRTNRTVETVKRVRIGRPVRIVTTARTVIAV